MGYIKEKKLTKHVCQPGKSSLQTGILPGFWILSTSLPKRVVELKFMVTLSCFKVGFQFYTFFQFYRAGLLALLLTPTLRSRVLFCQAPLPQAIPAWLNGIAMGIVRAHILNLIYLFSYLFI